MKLLRVKEVSEMAELHPSTLHLMHKRGKLTTAKAHEAESENLFSREARSFCLRPCKSVSF